MSAPHTDELVRSTRMRRAAVWLVLGGLTAGCGAAVLIDVPVATWLLAGLLAAVAAMRLVPATAPVLAARSLPFDLTVLLVLAGVLAVLAPAGLLD